MKLEINAESYLEHFNNEFFSDDLRLIVRFKYNKRFTKETLVYTILDEEDFESYDKYLNEVEDFLFKGDLHNIIVNKTKAMVEDFVRKDREKLSIEDRKKIVSKNLGSVIKTKVEVKEG